MRERTFLRLVSEIADRDDGVVTREELLWRDADPGQVDRGIPRGLYVRAAPGIYLSGAERLSQRALKRVALAAGGARASGLSHRCAGEHFRVLKVRPGFATVTSTRKNVAKSMRACIPMDDGKPGLILIRSSGSLNPVVVRGIACAPMARTLVDIAGSDGAVWLEQAWKGADYRGLLDPAASPTSTGGLSAWSSRLTIRATIVRSPASVTPSVTWSSSSPASMFCGSGLNA